MVTLLPRETSVGCQACTTGGEAAISKGLPLLLTGLYIREALRFIPGDHINLATQHCGAAVLQPENTGKGRSFLRLVFFVQPHAIRQKAKSGATHSCEGMEMMNNWR